MSTNSLPDRGAGSVSGSSGSRPSGLSYANYQKPSTASSYGGGSLSGRMYRDGEWLFHFVSHAHGEFLPAFLHCLECPDAGTAVTPATLSLAFVSRVLCGFSALFVS